MSKEISDNEYKLSSIIICLMERLCIDDVIIDPLNEIEKERSVLIVQQKENYTLQVRCMSSEEADMEKNMLEQERQRKAQ